MPEAMPEKVRPPGRFRAAWAWLGANKEQLSLIVTLVGAIWVLSEYRSKLASEQQAETAKYIDRYHATSYLDARTAINNVLYDPAHRDAILKARKDANLLEAFVSQQKLRSPILVHAEVYTNLARCVETSVCSRDVACTQFADDILGLYHTFRPLFTVKWKEMWGTDIMEEARGFAEKCPKRGATPAKPPRA